MSRRTQPKVNEDGTRSYSTADGTITFPSEPDVKGVKASTWQRMREDLERCRISLDWATIIASALLGASLSTAGSWLAVKDVEDASDVLVAQLGLLSIVFFAGAGFAGWVAVTRHGDANERVNTALREMDRAEQGVLEPLGDASQMRKRESGVSSTE